MTPELRERDPYNRWLARSSRVRVDAESERIRYAFRRTLGREPAPAETAELNALLERAKTHIRDGWVSAVELASGHNEPLSALPPGVTPTELAAYTVVTRALLNLDETITRE